MRQSQSRCLMRQSQSRCLMRQSSPYPSVGRV